MLTSPHVADLKPMVETWITNLQGIESITDIWADCQKKVWFSSSHVGIVMCYFTVISNQQAGLIALGRRLGTIKFPNNSPVLPKNKKTKTKTKQLTYQCSKSSYKILWLLANPESIGTLKKAAKSKEIGHLHDDLI